MKKVDRTRNSITYNSIIATLIMNSLTAEWLGLNPYEGYMNTNLFKKELKKVGSIYD